MMNMGILCSQKNTTWNADIAVVTVAGIARSIMSWYLNPEELSCSNLINVTAPFKILLLYYMTYHQYLV